MKTLMLPGAILTLVMFTTSCMAEKKTPGPGCDLKVGDGVGAFPVVKAGGVDDGVEVGQGLCYL